MFHSTGRRSGFMKVSPGRREDDFQHSAQGRTYAPNLEMLLGQETPNRTALRKVEDFEVKKDNEDEFFFFLDRVLFRSRKQRATLDAIQLDFGDTSRSFINTVQAMQRVMPTQNTSSSVHVAFEQWQRFLQLAAILVTENDSDFRYLEEGIQKTVAGLVVGRVG